MAKEILYRSSTIERKDNIDEEVRTIELSFSSEAPVERVFGNEVLEHNVDSVGLCRRVFVYLSFLLAGRIALFSLSAWSGAIGLPNGCVGMSRSTCAVAGWVSAQRSVSSRRPA